jgi:hypothetical protein
MKRDLLLQAQVWISFKKTIDTGNDKITVSINATVVKPNVNKYPVAGIEIKNFTQEQADEIIDVLFSGRTLYQPWGTTKADIELRIVHLKEIINNPNTTEEERGMAESELEFKQKQYLSAPDSIDKKPAITDFVTINPQDQKDNVNGQEYTIKGDDYNVINIWADANNNSRSVLNIYNINNGENSWMMYTGDVSRNFEGYLTYETKIESDQTKSGFKYADAEKTAKDMINKMGIDLNESSSSLVSYALNAKTQEDIDNAPYQAYKFYFTREINNVPVNYDTVISLGELDNDYSKAVYYEVASITIDENGIDKFEYRAPYKVIDIVENNAKIIELDEAIDKFSNHIKQTYTAATPDNPFQINIHTIVLGLSRIKNTDGRYVLIPTWDFMGNIIYDESISDTQFIDPSNPNMSEESLNPAYCIMTVNAIDGTIIDKSRGY